MKPPENSTFSRSVAFPYPDTVIGMFAGKKTALIYTGEGSDCCYYVQNAIEAFPNARFVIGIGVGYAFDSEQFKLGDVLVSKQICDFKHLKLSRDNSLIDRGQRVDVVKDLSSTFCKDLVHEEDFEVSDTKRCSNVAAGQFVSLPAVIENKDFRDKILLSVPQAIGGDMESRELLKFRMKSGIEGVAVIKGVSHYADGNRGEEWEFTASLAALHYANSKLHYYRGMHNARYIQSQFYSFYLVIATTERLLGSDDNIYPLAEIMETVAPLPTISAWSYSWSRGTYMHKLFVAQRQKAYQQSTQ